MFEASARWQVLNEGKVYLEMGALQELITSWRANSFVVVAFPASFVYAQRIENTTKPTNALSNSKKLLLSLLLEL